MSYPNELRLDAVEYYQEGLSAEEVLQALSADGNPKSPSIRTLSAWLRGAGFTRKRIRVKAPRNTKYPAEIKAAAADYYSRGMTSREVRAQLEYEGTPPPTNESILRWARAAGVKIRSSGFSRRGTRNPSDRHPGDTIAVAVDRYRRGFSLNSIRSSLIRDGRTPAPSISTIAKWIHMSDVLMRPAGRRRKHG